MAQEAIKRFEKVPRCKTTSFTLTSFIIIYLWSSYILALIFHFLPTLLTISFVPFALYFAGDCLEHLLILLAAFQLSLNVLAFPNFSHLQHLLPHPRCHFLADYHTLHPVFTDYHTLHPVFIDWAQLRLHYISEVRCTVPNRANPAIFIVLAQFSTTRVYMA